MYARLNSTGASHSSVTSFPFFHSNSFSYSAAALNAKRFFPKLRSMIIFDSSSNSSPPLMPHSPYNATPVFLVGPLAFHFHSLLKPISFDVFVPLADSLKRCCQRLK